MKYRIAVISERDDEQIFQIHHRVREAEHFIIIGGKMINGCMVL